MGAQHYSRAMVLSQTSLLITLFSLTLAYRKDYQPPKNQLNRRFFWSSKAPLTSAVNELAPDAIPHIDFTTRHFARMELAVRKSLNRTRVLRGDPITPCDPTIPEQYRKSLFRSFALRGFPEPAWNCGTDLVGVDIGDGPPGYTMDELYNAIFQQKALVQKRIRAIQPRVINNFTSPTVAFNFSYSTRSAKCTLTPVCGWRVGENWHQPLRIASTELDDHVQDQGRQAISEVPRVVDDKLSDVLLMRLPVWDRNDTERVFREDATTMIQRWGGSQSSSCFRRINIDENPAMVDALNKVDHSAQQAEDAVTSSNLAILVLPLGLNLVPIAFFANVNKRVMLLYTLLTDVLTVIPLGIKGLELVLIRSKRYRSVVTRILSPITGNLTVSAAAGGELWGAECRVREEVGRTGVILLITALVALVVGISAEIVARKHVMKKHAIQKVALLEGSVGYSFDDSYEEESPSGSIGVFGSDYERYSEDDITKKD